jgi:short-subunit dehydrogenase
MGDRRILITGGSQGIGAALVDAARAAGDKVVFTGRNEELIEKVASATGAHGVRADVSVTEDSARTLQECKEKMGGVDVLVNNAGYGYMAELRPHDIRVICVCPSEVQTAWGGKTGRNNSNKLYASDIAEAILSAISTERRALWPELAVFATNPWAEG